MKTFSGTYCTTFIVDPRRYLPWLQEKFLRNGGQLIRRRIESLTEDLFLHQFDAIVNCSGMGAKKLANDWKMVPIRGTYIFEFGGSLKITVLIFFRSNDKGSSALVQKVGLRRRSLCSSGL